MRLPLVMMMILLLINLAVDFYIWRCAADRCKSRAVARFQLISAAVLYVYLGVTLCIPRRDGTDGQLITVMWMLFGYFSIYVPKYIFTLLDLLSRIPLLFRRRRIVWLGRSAAILALLVFFGMWWGALVNRYHTQIREVTLSIPGLPESFDGYRIIQFSDAHVGTFGSDTSFICRTVDRINSLHPDLIVFTGDIVNRRSDELIPFVKPLSRLNAPDGVMSILGNHDYGDYCDWVSEQDKKDNMSLLYDLKRRMGWELLLNEHRYIVRDRDSLAIIGVENVGDPPFKVYGDLSKAYPSLSDSLTKVLLTHNPAHWTEDIENNDSINIALSLSGHTHAMQIEAFNLSPAYFRYHKWGGLYVDNNQRHRLYVNIGLGTVGIPMRLGATPELTIITLRSPERSR